VKPASSMDHVGFTLHIADIISNWRNAILSGDTTVCSLQTCVWGRQLGRAVAYGWRVKKNSMV
jgi:hypothetical protein